METKGAWLFSLFRQKKTSANEDLSPLINISAPKLQSAPLKASSWPEMNEVSCAKTTWSVHF